MYTAQTIVQQNKKVSIWKLPAKKLLPAFIVFIVGLGLSIVGKNLLDTKANNDRQAEFDKAVSSLSTRVENGLREQEQILKNLDGLYDVSVQVVRDVFELYSTVPAKSNPYILSIGYASDVAVKDVNDFVLYNRSERYFDYAVHPSGYRPRYEPISYVVPFESNQHLSGYDLLSNPVWADCVHRACSTSSGTVATPFFNYRGKDTTSMVLMMSVHKKKQTESADDMLMMQTAGDKFDGIIYVEIDAKKFFKSVIGDSISTDKNIVYHLSNKDLYNREKVIHTSANINDSKIQGKDLLKTDKSIKFGDQILMLSVRNSASLGGGIQQYAGTITLWTGIITTILLCGFLISVITSNQRAIIIADSITSSNQRILSSSNDMIAVFDLSGVWKTINPAVTAILGYEPTEVEGKHISKFFLADGANDELYTLIENAPDESTVAYDVRMKHKSNRASWISWGLTVSRNDGVIYAVGRDVTEAKRSEAEIKVRAKQVELAEQVAIEANEFKSSFMMRITDHLRDSLTDSLSGLVRISGMINPEDDNQLRFLELANQSSDQLFSIVNDLYDVAQEQKTDSVVIQNAYLFRCINDAETNIKELVGSVRTIDIFSTGINPEVKIKCNQKLVSEGIAQLACALTEKSKSAKIQFFAQENHYENVLELQIIAPQIEEVATLIKKYNISSTNIINNLEYDEDNILFRLAVAASKLRRVGGSMSVDTLGEEGNVALLTLPLAK